MGVRGGVVGFLEPLGIVGSRIGMGVFVGGRVCHLGVEKILEFFLGFFF